MKRRMACAALLCGLSATRLLAAADVRWLAPPGCTDSRATLEEAERLLGRPLKAVETLDFDVRITESDAKWQLKLSTVERATGERRERVLEGKSCDEVTAAAAVALAMVINSKQAGGPEPEGEPPTSERARPDDTAAAPTSPAKRQEEPMPTPPPARSLRWSVALAGLGDIGAFPELGIGAAALGAASYGPLRVIALGGVLVSSNEQAAGRGADFALMSGALSACAQRAVGPARAWLCAGAELGRLSGTGVGVRNPRRGGSLWWGPRADIGVTVPLGGSLAVLGQVGVIAPQIRPTFLLDDTIFVHRPDAIAVRLALGLELGLE